MGLSSVYGAADDEESKELLRHAIKIGQVSQPSPVALFGDVETYLILMFIE